MGVAADVSIASGEASTRIKSSSSPSWVVVGSTPASSCFGGFLQVWTFLTSSWMLGREWMYSRGNAVGARRQVAMIDCVCVSVAASERMMKKLKIERQGIIMLRKLRVDLQLSPRMTHTNHRSAMTPLCTAERIPVRNNRAAS